MRILSAVVLCVLCITSFLVAHAQQPTEKSPDVLEGTLRVHPTLHVRYFIDDFGDGQNCALLKADDRLQQIAPGSLLRVRGQLGSKLFGEGPREIATRFIYMDVDEAEVLRSPATTFPELSDQPLVDTALDRELGRVYAQLQPLFQKYYPQAAAANLHRNGVHFEYNVTTYEFPYTGGTKAKHEDPIQRGPKKGGVACSVFIAKGPYAGQLVMQVASESTSLGPVKIDKKVFTLMLMAPHSARQDVHLWAALSYPADASPVFIKEYVAILTAFEKDTLPNAAPAVAGKRVASHADGNGDRPNADVTLEAIAKRLAQVTELDFRCSDRPNAFKGRRDVSAGAVDRMNRQVSYCVLPAVPGDRVGKPPWGFRGANAIQVVATDGRYTVAAGVFAELAIIEKIAAELGQAVSNEGKKWLTPSRTGKVIDQAKPGADVGER